MDNLPRPGHVSKDRLVSSGAANVGDQTSAVASDLAAPSQAVLTYDELLDARDDELASLWPLARLPPIDDQSGLATTSRTPPAATSKGLQHPRRSAGVKVQQGLPVQIRSKARQAQHRSAGPRGIRVRHKQSRSNSAASASDSGTGASSTTSHATASDAEWNSKDNESTTGSEDTTHTAHFSDEGELSEIDDEVASAQAASAKRQKTDASVRVLYHGPSNDQLAAAAAAAMAPAGPRPLLGDVLSEAIHVQDVKRSACATGVPDEPLKEEDWQCIMRHRNAVACELDLNLDWQLVECGHQNHWYVRQCVQCDASRWDIELRARVSAILQTSRIEQTSTRQVINRLKAFSSGPPGLSPAFTTAMVQQAIDDCLALQADTAERKRTLHASKSGGAVTRETHLDRPIRGPIEGQSQLAEQLMAAAGLPSASEEMTCPAGSDQQGRNEPDASKPIEQEWGSTALALHQALSALAPSQSLPGTQRPTAHPGHSCQATTVASTSEPPQAEGASNQLNSSELSQTQQTGVDGTSAAVSADLQGAKCTGADVQRSQTAVAQGYHFATDLLEAVLRQQGKKVHTGYTSDLPAVWVRPRKPSQLAVTASQQHRKLFQMPALPKHQSQQATWKTPTTPAISIDYPIPSSHMAAGATEPSAQPEPSGGDNNKKRRRAATNSSLHPSCADLQEADMEARHQAEAQGLRQHAEGGLGSSAGGNSGNEAHCNPQGLKPTPVARALAGPTVHILVEGYDVYTKSGIGLTRGNAFPASEVTKVSQNSRHLWLRQRPFQLKRSTAEELATGAYRKGSGTKNNKPNKPPGDAAMLDKYRTMEGEAWKVFHMANKMGLRPDVIEKAAARFRVLHQRPLHPFRCFTSDSGLKVRSQNSQASKDSLLKKLDIWPLYASMPSASVGRGSLAATGAGGICLPSPAYPQG
ncbi:MAG: hypothetical protein FRX49_12637 [Trebouxia sp. A1-2]|nr:MAG: hypothetical protein FRX49_12637 [Trebouxia sp. A1-2]